MHKSTFGCLALFQRFKSVTGSDEVGGKRAVSYAQWLKAWLDAVDEVNLAPGICFRAANWTMRPSQTPGVIGCELHLRRRVEHICGPMRIRCTSAYG